MAAEINVVVENVVDAFTPVIFDLTVDVENVVVEIRAVGVSAGPICEFEQGEMLFAADVDDVVVDHRVAGISAEVEDAGGADTVVLADVVADDCALAVRAAGGADEHETAVVVVAVVELEGVVAALVVGIESLAVVGAVHAGDFVELDDGVVGGEGPDAGGGVGGAHSAAVNDVVLDESAGRAPEFDAVAADVFEQVRADNDMGAALVAGGALADAVAVGADDVAVFDQQIVEAGTGGAAGFEVNAATFAAFVQIAVDVVDVEV